MVVGESGRYGQVGDADRSGGFDGDEESQPGGVAEQRETLGPRLDLFGVVESLDGGADVIAVDDPAVSLIGGNKVHGSQSATPACSSDRMLTIDGYVWIALPSSVSR